MTRKSKIEDIVVEATIGYGTNSVLVVARVQTPISVPLALNTRSWVG